jgi:2-hydroxychromene-2-carboxylate isomerase
MPKTIDYFFGITSPWTYMGNGRLAEIAKRHGAVVNYKPVDMAKVFSVSGGLPLGKRAPQRQAYRLVELARWSRYLDIPLHTKPKYFPAAGWPASGMVIAVRGQGGDCGKLAGALMRAVWTEERNIDDAETLRAIATENGFDGDALLAAAGSDAVKAAFETDTQEAIDREVFGAPTYIYNGEPFWGQDRLDFLDRALGND